MRPIDEDISTKIGEIVHEIVGVVGLGKVFRKEMLLELAVRVGVSTSARVCHSSPMISSSPDFGVSEYKQSVGTPE